MSVYRLILSEMTDAWDACSYCGVAIYLCGKPAHRRCVDAAARDAGLHADKALCREHLHGGQWTRPSYQCHT